MKAHAGGEREGFSERVEQQVRSAPVSDGAAESAIYLHDQEEMEFRLFELLEIDQRFLGKFPFEKLTKGRVRELLILAKEHADRLARGYSDADGDHARLLENGEVVIPKIYHDLWKEHRRDWFAIRNQGDSVVLSGATTEPLPHVLLQAVVEMFVGANPSFMAYAGFTPSAINLIRRRGTDKQKAVFLEKLSATEWDACLCMTEPQAGSDLSAIATTARRLEGEVFSVVGEKRYITAGMHPLTGNTLYIVLGRIQGAKASSLSMSAFLIPRYWIEDDDRLVDNGVECVRVESKMGLNGCANTHLRFGGNGVTRGYLLGNRANVGLLQLQMLMRKARFGTGQVALALASSAYLRSLRYARQRIQGPSFDQSSNPNAPRVPIIRHLDVQRMLLEMRAKVEGCRALITRVSLYATCMQQMTPEERERDEAILRRHGGLALMLSPIAKAYVSDEAWTIATLAIQVHGAVGYLRDLPLEQYARDIKILTIWEGTNYIQSQDLVRDKLGFGRRSLVLQHFTEELRAFLSGGSQFPDLREDYDRLSRALDSVLATMAWVSGQAEQGRLLEISQFCTRILQMFGDLIAAWGLLEAAGVADRRLSTIAAADPRRPFYRGKIKTMRFFMRNLLPRLFSNFEIITAAESAYVHLDDAEFGFEGGSAVRHGES